MHRYMIMLVMMGMSLGLGVAPVRADVREIEGLDIVPREERGADESLKRATTESYERYLDRESAYEKWLAGVGNDPTGALAARKIRDDIRSQRETFVLERYPTELTTDALAEYEDGHRLWRPMEYKANKTKFIIHHTAGDRQFDDQQSVLSGLRDMYTFHAVKRGRGDIGYNFLIDQFGTIYEGRAGGAGVVGAHSERNNVTSIGIALIGNYERDEPSQVMIDALTRLLTVLAVRYDIAPLDDQPYFTATDVAPYIEVAYHSSLVGHKDVKSTACPGTHVYELLPEIRNTVAAYLAYFQEHGSMNFQDLIGHHLPKKHYFQEAVGTVVLPLDEGGALSCLSTDERLRVKSCTRSKDGIHMRVERLRYPASGRKHFLVTVGAKNYLVDTTIVRDDDVQRIMAEKKNSHTRQFGPPASRQASKKITDRIDIEQAQRLLEGDISVLLYELTALYDRRELNCLQGCDVDLGDQVIEDAERVDIVEDKENDKINVFVDMTKYPTDEVTIKNDHLVMVQNYPRSGAGAAWNIFRGDLIFRKERYWHLDYERLDRYVVINRLAVEDYFKGIAETSERQQYEKLKAMSMLVKAYTLFYLSGKNQHPSIPEGASYTAVDDPRIFQKYVGAGVESYNLQRKQALRDTEDYLVTYQGWIPILPYFHCSAGFTWSALERFGRTDTPWLKSKLDFTSCVGNVFEGHGVGLSGDGAERLARKGASWREIIQYYYDGVRISRID